MPGIKGVISEISKTVSEGIIKPVSDEVGLAIEAGVQSVTGTSTPQDPKAQAQSEKSIAQKEQQNKTRVTNIKNFFDQMKANEAREAQLRHDMAEQDKIQNQQEASKKAEIKQFEVVKKEEAVAVTNAKTRAEVKGKMAA